DPVLRLRRRHRRRHGEPEGRAGGEPPRRPPRQLRQGALPRAVLLHPVCPDGGHPGHPPHRALRPAVARCPPPPPRPRAAPALPVPAAGPPFLPPFPLSLLTQTLIYAILAMGLDLILGYTGLSSLGQAAYLGIGAYAVGILATQRGAGFWTALAVGVALAAA